MIDAGSLIQVATIARAASSAADGQGGFTETPAAPSTSPVRLLLQPASPHRIFNAERMGEEISHTGFALGDADIRKGDVLTVDGVAYEVRSTYRIAGTPPFLKLEALERQPAR